MKKFLALLFSAILAVCICLPIAACGGGEEVTKRIIGIDSDKTYMKAVYHLAHRKDLVNKDIVFEFYSYDKVKESELQGAEIDATTDYKYENMSVASCKIREFEYNAEYGCYRYYVTVTAFMSWLVQDVWVNSITLKIAGKDYKFSADIHFIMDTYRNVFVGPDAYGFNQYSSGRTEPFGLHIHTKYETTLKSLKFQTGGFEILSYFIEYYNISQDHTIVKVGDSLPITLEPGGYQIFVEAIEPDDCLYYGYEIEAVVAVGGLEMKYNNVDGLDYGVQFKGSALNVLKSEMRA